MRIFLQARGRGHRQSLPDSTVCRRRTCSGFAGARRRGKRHRRDRQYGALLLLEQKPGIYIRHRCAVRAQHPAAYIVAVVGRWPGHAQRSPERIQLHRHSDRQHRRANGRLVPQGNEDLKGLKFRVGGFAGTIIARVGGVPQQIAAGDIYPALEKGTIDAAEWVGHYDDEKLGFVKVAKYYYYPGWWEGTGQGHNIINMEKWNALPKVYQAAVTTASHDTFTWVTGKYDYVNPPALKRLVAAGAILRPFPQEVLETCYNAATEIYAELSKSNPHFGKMYASLVAYRNESLAWMQVAELSFDSFMMRMRTRT